MYQVVSLFQVAVGGAAGSHTELSSFVPFGWGTFHSIVDLEEAVDDLARPTIEHEYRFEKINLRQGMMGAPIDLPMRADNSIVASGSVDIAFLDGENGSDPRVV